MEEITCSCGEEMEFVEACEPDEPHDYGVIAEKYVCPSCDEEYENWTSIFDKKDN